MSTCDQRAQSILTEIASRITEQQFETWFRNIDLTFVPPASLRIRAPNRFHELWISRKYGAIITDVVRRLTGQRPELQVIVDERLAKTVPAAAEQVLPAADPVPVPPPTIPLNPTYTFENFIVGPANRLAQAAAISVVEGPGRTYNPLFIHGNSGLGKTHLMHAICHALHARGLWNVCYVSCETFTNQFIDAIGSGSVASFRQRYRYVDLLLVDDVHFLGGKERTQQEFFHTFNALYNHEKQLVLSSDRPPREIDEIEDRLVSRFKWGLVAHIDPPSLETRIAIIKKKAKIRGRDIPDAVAQYLASALRESVRDLEGAVNRIFGLSSLNHVPIDLDVAKEALIGLAPSSTREVHIADIQNAVVEYFDVRLKDLQSRRRTKAITLPRQVGMYLARVSTKLSLEEIGGYFGGRDHTTVRYAVTRIEGLKEQDPRLRAAIESISARLGIPHA